MSNIIYSDQLVPHSIEAEEAVLGSILIDPGALSEVIPFLSSDDFFIIRHSWIWDAMLQIHKRREPLDYLTVVSELDQAGKLKESGGAAYILDLINKTPSALNVDGYGRIVERLAVRRRLIDAAQKVARSAHSEETNIEEAIIASTEAVRGVAERHLSTVSLSRDISDIAADVQLDAIAWRDNPSETRGIATGLYPLDKATGGLEPGKLYELAARPRMGKSALLARAIRGAAEQGHYVILFSLEMSDTSMARRMGIQISKINASQLKEGKLSQDDFDRFMQAMDTIGKMPITIERKSGLSVLDLRSMVSVLSRDRNVGLVIVDTINCLRSDVKNPYENMTNISHALKDWAHESSFPILCAVQFKRVAYPTLEGLRDSGALEEDADWIGGLHRPYEAASTEEERIQLEMEGKEHLAELIVLKNRDGEGAYGTEMHWDGPTLSFERIDINHVDLNEYNLKPRREPKFVSGRDDPGGGR